MNIPDKVLDRVMELDCRKEDNVRRLRKSLAKLPFIKNEKDLEIDRLEVFIKKMEIRYDIHLSYIMRSYINKRAIYNGTVRANVRNETGKWVKNVYSMTMWEMYAKTLFFMYYLVKKESMPSKKGTDREGKGGIVLG